MTAKADKRRLYVAHVNCADEGLPGGSLNMIYGVLALSPGEAVRAIRRERGTDCTVAFKTDHGLKEAETIERLGLDDGRARCLA